MFLPISFYLQEDVVDIAKQLIGKKITSTIEGQKVSGIISETEAYAGVCDKASHAYGGKITKRNAVMYEEGGKSYVYLCYGMHYLFNVVTNVKGIPHAVLIRNVIPLEGIEVMEKRRKISALKKTFLTGPATFTQAFGINMQHNRLNLLDSEISICKFEHPFNEIIAGPRIGVAYAGKDALLPYRFLGL